MNDRHVVSVAVEVGVSSQKTNRIDRHESAHRRIIVPSPVNTKQTGALCGQFAQSGIASGKKKADTLRQEKTVKGGRYVRMQI
jgi:hypothetical protein